MSQDSIKSNINQLQRKLGEDVTLVAVSKTKPKEMILEAYDAGHRDFGENKAQELTAKAEELPADIRWHMIGHLQRNKVKYIAPFVHLIHAVDSDRLLKEINKQATKNNRVIKCLFQVYIADEESKFGWSPDELLEYFDSGAIKEYPNVEVVGLMGMATFTSDMDKVREEFLSLQSLFEKIRDNYTYSNLLMKTLSIGMTNDYEVAIKCGGNMVRIGTAVFGARDNH